MRIRCDFPLIPLPLTVESNWDVELVRRPAAFFEPLRPELPRLSGEPWFTCRPFEDGALYLRWRGIFEFLVDADGKTIFCRALKRTSLESFRTYLLGQVLSFALVSRGVEPLHGTAVVIDGKAIALMGDCGYGKSSLGAAFVSRGHRLLTDDLLVLKERKAGYWAYPGAPRLKLFPSVALRVLGRTSRGKALNPGTAKLILPLEDRERFAERAPLAAIYLLPSPHSPRRNVRGDVRILSLSQSGAFFELVRNTFNPVVVDKERLGRQFHFVRKLAGQGLVRRLSFPRKLELLPRVCDRILEDLHLHA